ncbi:MAG: TIR domain-containing protein [Magnetococcales bacterium]|nr:TIR domain-containing protein [Magnetococcales bacterium]
MKLGDALRKNLFDQVAQELRDRIESIRLPSTGESPTVVITGDRLENLAWVAKGSPELLSLVRQRLNPEEVNNMSFVDVNHKGSPKAFLSYASEDRDLAEKIANYLVLKGVDAWWDQWEIKSGDSVRRKIEEGLGECTHFIVLLTQNSVVKPWVNAEIDAGFRRKVEENAKFIPLRHDLPVGRLSEFLRTMHSPEIKESSFEGGMKQLVHDIFGISRKPPLGPAPEVTALPDTGYSKAAMAIAKVFVEKSRDGMWGDPQITMSKLSDLTGLSRDDVIDGVDELNGMLEVKRDGTKDRTVFPDKSLFAKFDAYFMAWNPEVDALRLAADLTNDENFPSDPREISERYGWPPRRLNPAITFLDVEGLIKVSQSSGNRFSCVSDSVRKTSAMRRFVKSRS